MSSENADYIIQSSFTMGTLKAQMRRYVNGIFADALKSLGFVSYKDESLSWYRVRNEEILQTVYFFSTQRIPFIVEIAYGIHPLYIPAPIPQKVYIHGGDVEESDIMWQLLEVWSGPKVIYEGTGINCQATPKRGLEILENRVFPLFETLQTEDTLYNHTKNFCAYDRSLCITETFFDQVIYRGDTTEYKRCLDDTRPRCENLKEIQHVWPSIKKRVERYQARIDAIEKGERDAYVAHLEDQKRKFIKAMERKLGIKV